MDVLYQVHFRRRKLARTQLGRDAPLDGAVLSIYLPQDDLRPTPPPAEELPGLLDRAVRLRRELPFATWLSYEGAPTDLEALLDARVSVVGLAHFWHSEYADAATDPRPGSRGLSEKGEQAVRTIYRAGALVDVSHLSDESFADVARLADEEHAPIVATHSATRAVFAHERNLTDAQLRAVARSGGIVGVLVHAPHLAPARKATAADWAAHVTHVIEVAGPQHVALGSDLDGLIQPLDGIRGAGDLAILARALGKAGYGDETIAAVLGGNARRLLERR